MKKSLQLLEQLGNKQGQSRLLHSMAGVSRRAATITRLPFMKKAYDLASNSATNGAKAAALSSMARSS